MCTVQTTNERLNQSRYEWMKDEFGAKFNRFDRGWVANVLEFYRVSPRYVVDYTRITAMPACPPERTRQSASSNTAAGLSSDGAFRNSTGHDDKSQSAGTGSSLSDGSIDSDHLPSAGRSSSSSL